MNFYLRLWGMFRVPVAKKTSLIFLGILVLSVLLSSGLSAGITYWRSYFIDSFNTNNFRQWQIAMLIFSGLAFSNILISGYSAFFARKLEFFWREEFYYTLAEKYSNKHSKCAVPEQRLSQDTIQISELTRELIESMLTSIIKLPLFLSIVVKVAGWKFAIFGLIYSILGSVVARLIARPLVKLDYDQQSREGSLYRALIKFVQSDSKQIPPLTEVKRNWSQLAIRNKWLKFFTSGYGQLSNIIPFALLAPAYFSGALTMGILWTTADAFGQLLDAAAFFVEKRDSLARADAVLKRLEEL